MSWIDQAACRGTGELFLVVPQRGRTGRRPPLSAEQRVCMGCPVLEVCLWHALADETRDDYDPHGLRGGLYPVDRGRLAQEVTPTEALRRYEVEKEWAGR